VKHLDRDAAGMLPLLCQVDGRHPAIAEGALNDVAACQNMAGVESSGRRDGGRGHDDTTRGAEG
jgi:hypothetical protein